MCVKLTSRYEYKGYTHVCVMEKVNMFVINFVLIFVINSNTLHTRYTDYKVLSAKIEHVTHVTHVTNTLRETRMVLM